MYLKTVIEEKFSAEEHQILNTEMFLGNRNFVYIFIPYSESRLHKPVLIWQVNGVVTVSKRSVLSLQYKFQVILKKNEHIY